MKFGDVMRGDVTLDALVAEHKDRPPNPNWINITHFDWQVDWAVTTRAGTSNARSSKAPTMGNVTITKETDNASTDFLDAITRNRRINNPQGETCIIRFLSTGQGNKIGEMRYQEFTFYETLVSQILYSADGENRPTEKIQMNFTGMEMNVWPREAGNTVRVLGLAPPFERYNKIPASK
jgi:type VI protein secretion system component Hcp